jgi:hypothetical protein
MNGVSADLGELAPGFDAFLERSTAMPPIAGSHYYFDAVALLSLAVAEGIAQTGALPAPASMKDHMLSVTSAGGTIVTYDQLATALALLAAGQRVQYVGAAGVYVLNSLGDSTLNRGAIWQIQGSEFQTIGYQQCAVTEVRNAGGV